MVPMIVDGANGPTVALASVTVIASSAEPSSSVSAPSVADKGKASTVQSRQVTPALDRIAEDVVMEIPIAVTPRSTKVSVSSSKLLVSISICPPI